MGAAEGSARAPAVLLESAAFRGFLDAISAAMLVCDVDGSIDFANGNTELLTGYARSEQKGAAEESLVPTAVRTNGTESIQVTGAWVRS